MIVRSSPRSERFFETAVSLVRDGLLGPREAVVRFDFSEGKPLKALR